mgnify:CR=1 FL=1
MARHFSRQEIEEIRAQLATYAVKDSEFPDVTALSDDDCIAIIQHFNDGSPISENAKLTLTQLAAYGLEKFSEAVSIVATRNLSDGSVTTDKIHQDAVTTEKIANHSITNEKMANDSVDTDNIVDHSVINAKLDDGSVSWGKLDDNVQNIISTSDGEHGIPLATEFGDSDLLGITQRVITGAKENLQSQINDIVGSEGTINTRIATAKEEILGEVSTDYNTLKKLEDKVSPLETAIGTGGSVDERIATAKSELIGDAASEYNTLGKLEDRIQEETTARYTNHYTKSETYTKTEVNNLITTPNQEYVTVSDYASLPATGSADTIYRVSNYDGTQVDTSKYAEYAWDGTQYILLSVKSQAYDIFDVSDYNSGATYESLSSALAAIPASAKRAGMTIKFIQLTPATYTVVKTEGLTEAPTGTLLGSTPSVESGTYQASGLSDFATLPASTGSANAVTYYTAVTETIDEEEVTTYTTWVITKATDDVQKYVQYRLMNTAWSTVVGDWQGVDDEPVAGSENLVKSGGLALELGGLIAEGSANVSDSSTTTIINFLRLGYTIPAGTTICVVCEEIRTVVSAIKFIRNSNHTPYNNLNRKYSEIVLPEDLSSLRVVVEAANVLPNQDGENVHCSIYLKGVNQKIERMYAASGSININSLLGSTADYTLATVIAAVPSEFRTIGRKITFLASGKYVNYRFVSSNLSDWETTAYWEYIADNSCIYCTTNPIYLTKRLKELYLTGLDSNTSYRIDTLRYSSQLLFRIYNNDTDTQVCACYGHTLKGIIGFTETHDSGVSGYALIDMSETDTTNVSATIINDIVGNVDYSPSIKAALIQGTVDDINSSYINQNKLVDNLTTGGSDKVLSAEQGKLLNQKVLLNNYFFKFVPTAAGRRITELDGLPAGTVIYRDFKDVSDNSTYNNLRYYYTLDGNSYNKFLNPAETLIIGELGETDGYFVAVNGATSGNINLVINPIIAADSASEYETISANNIIRKHVVFSVTDKVVSESGTYIWGSTIPKIPKGATVHIVFADDFSTWLTKYRLYLNGASTYTSVTRQNYTFIADDDITQIRVRIVTAEIISGQTPPNVDVEMWWEDIGMQLDSLTSKVSTLLDINKQTFIDANPTGYDETNDKFGEGVYTVQVAGENNVSVLTDVIANYTAKYTSTGDSYPYIQLYFTNVVTSAWKYPIGGKGFYKYGQCKCIFPGADGLRYGNSIIKARITVPSGCELYLKNINCEYSNSLVNKDAFKVYQHGTERGGSNCCTRINWDLWTHIGNYGAIVIPKRTVDGRWVCYHDDSFSTDQLQVIGDESAALPAASMQECTFAETQTLEYKATNIYGEHETIPALEEFFAKCAIMGVHPALSCHPTRNVSSGWTYDKWSEVRDMAYKYRVLDRLTIKSGFSVGAAQNFYDIFGDDIEAAIFDVSSLTTEQIDDLDSVGWDTSKVKVGFEILAVDSYFSDEIITYLESKNMVHGIAPGSNSSIYYDAKILKDLIDKGCWEITANNFYSNGLNW